jgi:hypothetical protein
LNSLEEGQRATVLQLPPEAERSPLTTPRRREPRAPLARPAKGAASARTACSALRVVH